MEELIRILNKIKPGVDFSTENRIVDDQLLDSLSIIRLVSEIDDEFDVEIPVTELLPKNFNSLQAIMQLIQRLQDE